MKLLREYIRELIKEQAEASEFTVGYVVDSIKALREIEKEQDEVIKAQKEKEYKEKKMWKGAKVIASLLGAGSVINIAKMFRDAAKKNIPDVESSKDPILAAMDIDDKYAAMLDDNLENEFIDRAISGLDSLDRNAKLPDMDRALEKFVREKYGRIIDGANE